MDEKEKEVQRQLRAEIAVLTSFIAANSTPVNYPRRYAPTNHFNSHHQFGRPWHQRPPISFGHNNNRFRFQPASDLSHSSDRFRFRKATSSSEAEQQAKVVTSGDQTNGHNNNDKSSRSLSLSSPSSSNNSNNSHELSTTKSESNLKTTRKAKLVSKYKVDRRSPIKSVGASKPSYSVRKYSIRKVKHVPFRKSVGVKILQKSPIKGSHNQFVARNGGRSLRRVSFSTNLNSSSSFSQSYSQSRVASNRVIQKSKSTLAARKKKTENPKAFCKFYNRFGRCVHNDNGICPFIHDSKHLMICPRFVAGKCEDKACKLSHNLKEGKMPGCQFFSAGKCKRKDCPFPHIETKVESSENNNSLTSKSSNAPTESPKPEVKPKKKISIVKRIRQRMLLKKQLAENRTRKVSEVNEDEAETNEENDAKKKKQQPPPKKKFTRYFEVPDDSQPLQVIIPKTRTIDFSSLRFLPVSHPTKSSPTKKSISQEIESISTSVATKADTTDTNVDECRKRLLDKVETMKQVHKKRKNRR